MTTKYQGNNGDNRRKRRVWVAAVAALMLTGCTGAREETQADAKTEAAGSDTSSMKTPEEVIEEAKEKTGYEDDPEDSAPGSDFGRAKTSDSADSTDSSADSKEKVTIWLTKSERTIAGEYIVGENIEEGEYLIKPTEQSNLFVLDGGITPYIFDPDGKRGASQFHTFLFDGMVFILNEDMYFYEVLNIDVQEHLYAGHWIVGHHILPGTYRVTTEPGELGRIVVESLTTNEVFLDTNDLDNQDTDFTKDLDFEIELEMNQLITIHNFNKVNFKKR